MKSANDDYPISGVDPAADALALIELEGDEMAYAIARRRSRAERGATGRLGYWDRVRVEVARITGRVAGVDTATRMVM